ncbi:LysR family transcriptional regulator [Hydrogenophaga laconesensis]|uniref:DNA-binding transcriptional LysR family regulator n=1 Tax=Hydrogenophaga laconesensis TaxID=1805971 RepID=A0ABU1VDY9_9BURK|nr:LysR family transcriptional regulator [Hydrogenophaga laconesensis]MDR7095691.1 DNA-binding transcriptional LysR family regulator [Hydrogenophaga laconesensis]
MDRFQEMQVFVRIAERGSFTQAADDLQLPRATVSNLIRRLESRLGVRLLERTTRTVRTTPDGEAYRQRCERLLADLEEADGLFRHAAPKGLLRVNLQGTLARRFVVPALPDFLARHPQLELQIGEDDRLVDLVREGVDCVLRAGQLRDSTLVARRVARLQQLTCASPAYLERFGVPDSLPALAGHRAVNYVSSATGQPLPLEFMVGDELRTVSLAGPVSVTGADVYAGAALAGLGLVQVPRYRVAEELASGQLLEVLPDLPVPELPISVLYPQSRQLSVRVRVFVQWVAELFESVR